MKRNICVIFVLCLVIFTSCNRHETYDPVTVYISFVNYTDMDFDSLQIEYHGFPYFGSYKIYKTNYLSGWDTTRYVTCDSIDEGFELMLHSDSLAFYTRWDYPSEFIDPVNPQLKHFSYGYYHYGIFPADSLNSDMHIGLESHTTNAIY
ncbi:MAG: hypothetical protein U9N51_05335 [Bacteroidota bacterium]|nr:hypothetical protein [Bacteroidota bacterium]